MRFLYVNRHYIEFLQKFDASVMKLDNPNYKVNKFAIGVVFKVNEINYFAPVSSIKKKQLNNIDDTNLEDFYEKLSYPIVLDTFGREEIVATIKFNYMIPIHHKDVRSVITSKLQPMGYKKFVDNQYSFCLKNHAAIKNMAAKVYSNAVNRVDDFDKLCVDFKKLEEKYQSWILDIQQNFPFSL
jgi:protein AbiQ